MSLVILPIPDEPVALKSIVRTLLEQAPEEGLPLVLAGEWIADPLWERWGEMVEKRGMRREQFGEIVSGYANELRLWVVGERPWDQAAGGLAGRVARRLHASVADLNGHVRSAPWQDALSRVGIDPDSEMAALVSRIGELQLLYEVAAPDCHEPHARVASAIVWAGGRPRDPEVPYGESGAAATDAAALAEALGRFLLNDPAYPPR
jgi:hypothetical protein